MVRPERFELPTYWFVARRSIQLSYGRTRVASSETIDRLSGFSRRRKLGYEVVGAGSGCRRGGTSSTTSKPAWRTSWVTSAALRRVASYSTRK